MTAFPELIEQYLAGTDSLRKAVAGMSREQLLDSVWGMDRAVTDRTVDVHVLRLRQKVEGDPANPLLIRSVRGFGYLFEASAAAEVQQ